MTNLAELAAQLSPQAREMLARELIRAGTRCSAVDEVAGAGGGGGDWVSFPR